MYLRRPPKISNAAPQAPRKVDQRLIDQLLQNRISLTTLEFMRRRITPDDLSDIIQRIYDLNEKYILELSAVEGILRKLNELKNSRRNQRFHKKINAGFRNPDHPNNKVILAEGDSWFNYPIILTDIIDRIAMEEDFAVHSLASGGDWLLNMLTARQYVEEMSVLHPDVFLISGGGNDLVGSSRLAAMLDASGKSIEFEQCELAQYLIKQANTTQVPLITEQFNRGISFLSKDFFALLMFFHLQYYYLISHLLQNANNPNGKFFGLQIITQGYDYPIPSFEKSFGYNPLLWYVPFIRMFLGHGGWLKSPMLSRGVTDPQDQRSIVYAMIYLFNEMMIYTGRPFTNHLGKPLVFHIDSRGSVGEQGWADELHPRPQHFMKTAGVFIHCLRQTAAPSYGHVYVVKNFAE